MKFQITNLKINFNPYAKGFQDGRRMSSADRSNCGGSNASADHFHTSSKSGFMIVKFNAINDQKVKNYF